MASWPKLAAFIFLLFLTLAPVGCGDIEGELTSLAVDPSAATVGVNQSYSFSASGRNSVGTYVTVKPAWTIEGAIGTISSTGLFKAGASEGTGYVVATSGEMESKATVTVTVTGWLTGTITDTNGGVDQGIAVYLAQDRALQATSGSDGKYSIPSIPAGTYTAVIDANSRIQSAAASSEAITISQGETKTWYPVLIVPTTTSTTLPPLI